MNKLIRFVLSFHPQDVFCCGVAACTLGWALLCGENSPGKCSADSPAFDSRWSSVSFDRR